MVYYLAVFARAFNATARYAEARDRDGMLFCGELADALHNVPTLLRDWREDRSKYHTPEAMRHWVGAAFPERIAASRLPEHIRQQCRAILDPEGVAATLGLVGDLSDLDLDLAPPAKLAAYFGLLYRACLNIRYLRGHGDLSNVLISRWERWQADVRSRGHEREAYLGQLAASTAIVPCGLVRWCAFDESAFFQHLRAEGEVMQPDWARQWQHFFDRHLLAAEGAD